MSRGSSSRRMVACFRCAVNATPEKMSDAAAQLEDFLEAVSGNRKQHKTVHSNISEVKVTCWSHHAVTSLFLMSFFFSFVIETTRPSK